MKKLSLSVKLSGGFLIVGLIVLIVGFVGWRGVDNSSKNIEKINYLQGISKQLLEREIDHLNWARKLGQFQRDENMRELHVEKDEHKCAFGKWYYSEERRKAEEEIPEIRDLLKMIEEPHTRLHRSAQEVERLLKKGMRKDAIAYYGSETSEHLAKVQDLFAQIRPKVEEHSKKGIQNIRDQAKQTTGFSLMGMIVGTILALGLGFFLSRSISKPIHLVAAGLSEGSEQVASASAQVSSASQSLAEGASEQAAGIQETSSSIEEMSSMTKKNAESTNQANNLMMQTSQVVDEANHAMKELINSMNEISSTSEETAKIIKTIDEIAFQTNLLALNAAVEAARAGEAGAGFAVVADEVRNLAMRAAEAAKNTASLIEESVKKIKNGSQIVFKTNEAFEKVAVSSKKVAELMAEIAAASQEQSQGIEQINKAMAEMDKVVQKNAASAEESASAAEEMNAQAETMKGFVEELMALVGKREGNGWVGTKEVVSKHFEVKKIGNNGGKHLEKVVSKIGVLTKKDNGKFAKKEAVPSQVIPLEEEDFKEF